jgi:O-antigen/teichoic acid export membrane protein
MSAKKQLFSVATISVIDKCIKLGFLAVLSRLLTPADLGAVAAALLVVGFAELFSNAGLSACVVQYKTLSGRDIRTATTLSFLMGLLLASVLLISAPLIIHVLGIDTLSAAIPWLALILVFRGLSAISGALLQRNLQVAKVMWIGVAAYVLGAALVSVPLALKGYGYLSVVLALVVENFLYMIGLYIATRHSLLPLLDRDSSRRLLRKGMGFFATRTLNYFAQNLDYVIVSRMLGSSALGLYSRAYKIMEYPSIIYRNAIDRVLFPLFAREQDNQVYLSKAIITGLFLTTALSAGISAFIVANSAEIVLFLLGNQWGETATVLSILAIFSTFRMNYMICLTYVRSRGLLRIASIHSMVFLCLVGVFSYLGVPYGITGVGVGAGIAVLIFCLSYTVHVCHLANIRLVQIGKIYAFGLLVFLWIYGANAAARLLLPMELTIATLTWHGIVSGVAAMMMLHPVLRFLWRGPGIEMRDQSVVLLSKLSNRLLKRSVSVGRGSE